MKIFSSFKPYKNIKSEKTTYVPFRQTRSHIIYVPMYYIRISLWLPLQHGGETLLLCLHYLLCLLPSTHIVSPLIHSLWYFTLCTMQSIVLDLLYCLLSFDFPPQVFHVSAVAPSNPASSDAIVFCPRKIHHLLLRHQNCLQIICAIVHDRITHDFLPVRSCY